MESNINSLNLREVLYILKKHMRLILMVTIIFGILGFLTSKCIISPQYRANAMLIVNPGQTTQSTSITYDQVTMTHQLVGTYSIILKSDTVLDQVIKDLSLNADAKQLAKNITVAGVGETEVIQISVKDTDPEMATRIANDIINVAPAVIIKTVKAGSVEIISPAKTNNEPVSPNIPLNTAIAFLAGIVLAVIAAFITELMNNTFTSDEDIQKHLGFTVLGVIPNYETKTQG